MADSKTTNNVALENLQREINLNVSKLTNTHVDYNVDINVTSYNNTISEAESLKQFLNTSTYNESTATFEDSNSTLSNIGDSDSKTFWDKLQEEYAASSATAFSRWTNDIIAGSGDGVLNNAFSTIESAAATGVSLVTSDLADVFSTITENGADSISSTPLVGSYMIDMMNRLSGTVQSIAGALSSLGNSYNDGSTETAFGAKQEKSWQTLISAIESKTTNFTINKLKTTPLDPGTSQTSMYGNMMLGCPPNFISTADPLNRTMINTFVKDAKFVSLTPGMPKYNGSRYIASTKESILRQTDTAREMLDYLIQNGVNKDTLSKDKRYYTFQPAYGKFYSYLETMLNTVWIKLGLGTEDSNTFNIYSFFPELTANDNAEPLSQYHSAIGFFVNPVGGITENITNERTSFGETLASDTNTQAEEYQRINYLTGMGTGGAGKEASRALGVGANVVGNLKNFASDALANTVKGFTSNSGIVRKAIGAVGGIFKDYVNNVTTVDNGALLQSFTAVNGMRVTYPELWSSSSYSQSISLDFNFFSPYGDPLSIFKYVYVPFFTLLTFTLPRQADDNGFVSPFFVRADIPGYMTCDLGMITNFSFTRGGAVGLFSKDGLPRCISGTFSIESLFPYLSMSRRISFLSANPSYTSFLDSFSGFASIYDESDETSLNEYFKNMLNRVNGESNSSGIRLWNRFDLYGKSANKTYADQLSVRLNTKPTNISWLRKV